MKGSECNHLVLLNLYIGVGALIGGHTLIGDLISQYVTLLDYWPINLTG
jgi:hypothetical protein